MSLIDEALKRARMEAAQRAAEGEGLPYPTIPRHLGPRRRRAWWAPLAVLLAVLGGLFIGWLMATRGPRGEQVANRVDGGTTAEPVTSGPPTPAQITRDPIASDRQAAESVGSPASDSSEPEELPPAAAVPGPPAAKPITSGPARPEEVSRDPAEVPEPEIRTPVVRTPATRTQVSEAPVTEAPETRRSSAPPPPPPATPRPAESAPVESPASRPESAPPRREPPPAAAPTTVTDPDSGVLLVLPERPGQNRAEVAGEPSGDPAERYVQSYPLPDGGAIELGGIAWSETGPFALVNGRVVGPGTVIDGYVLEGIRPGHVVLTGDGRRIHLSLQ